MQINNNYAISQPKFGKLKSINTLGDFSINRHKEALDVMKSFKESKAISKFCEKYDVDTVFHAQSIYYAGIFNSTASVTLATKEKVTGFWNKFCNWFKNPVEVKIYSDLNEKYCSNSLENLSSNIKKVTFNELEADYARIKQEPAKKKLTESRLKNEYNDTVDSLLKC